HDADLLAKRLQRERLDVHAIEQNPPFARVVESRQQADKRALSCAGGPDNRDRLPGNGFERDVRQRFRATLVPKTDALELHASPRSLNRNRAGCVADIRLLVEELEGQLQIDELILQCADRAADGLEGLVYGPDVRDDNQQ